MRTVLGCLLAVLIFICACTSPSTDKNKGVVEYATDKIPVETEFGRTLGFVPYSFLEERDIWFINFGKAKEMYGVEDITSIEDTMDLPDDRRGAISQALTETGGTVPNWRSKQLSSLIGFDGMMTDRIINIGVVPPKTFSISEGNFDEELITGKLTEQGYSNTDYGSYSYYGIREDLNTDIRNPLGRLVMASMNRLAVFDDTIIASPVTEYVTSIFDAMAGDTPSVIDNAACRALADSLGDVLTAVMTTPERIITVAPEMEEAAGFDFAIPDDWGLLHGYDMAALGYKAEGEKRFLVIALYYVDEETATADGKEIANRMKNYNLGTMFPNLDDMPFTELYRADEPVVRQYADGAVVTIDCQLIPEGRRNPFGLMGGAAYGPRDLLFLTPDPSVYVKE